MANLIDFETDHLNFIQFRESEEHEKFTKSFRDSEAMKYCKDMFYQGYKLMKNHRMSPDQNYFIVQDKQTGEFAGAIFVSGLSRDNSRAISYAIDKGHRNQGYGSVVLAESIMHLWNGETNNIEIHVRNDNEGSKRLSEKLGFKIAIKTEGEKDTSKYILEKTKENQELLQKIIQQFEHKKTQITQETTERKDNKLRQSISPQDLREASKTRFPDFCRQAFVSLMSNLRSIYLGRPT